MNISFEATAAATTGQIPLSPTSPGPATPGSSEKPNNNTFPQLNAEALGALVEAVREPLIVCLGRVKSSASGQSSIVPGRVLTANPMACALLNRDLEEELAPTCRLPDQERLPKADRRSLEAEETTTDEKIA